MRLLMRITLIGLVALVALGYLLNQPKPLANKSVSVSQGLCQDSGTSLVIDFGTDSNKPKIEKCIKDFTGTSWNLLKAAGIKVEGTEKYPAGFVCRINGQPDATQEKCIDTPGALNGSWAFFTATSSKWEYSAFGASMHKAQCGTTEGWRFLRVDEALTTFPRSAPVINSCEK